MIQVTERKLHSNKKKMKLICYTNWIQTFVRDCLIITCLGLHFQDSNYSHIALSCLVLILRFFMSFYIITKNILYEHYYSCYLGNSYDRVIYQFYNIEKLIFDCYREFTINKWCLRLQNKNVLHNNYAFYKSIQIINWVYSIIEYILLYFILSNDFGAFNFPGIYCMYSLGILIIFVICVGIYTFRENE